MSRLKNWRRALGWMLAVAILIFLAQTLVSSWDKVAASGFHFQFNLPLLAVSLVLLVIGRGFAVEAWRRVLMALGNYVPFRFAFYAWFISNLTRYVPGNIWQVATMMLLVEREGVSKMNALLSQAVYTAIALSVTALFGLTLLPIAQDYLPFAALLFIGLIIFFALPPVFRLILALTSRLTQYFRRDGTLDSPAPGVPRLGFASGLIPPLCSTAMWTTNGIAFYLFVRSITNPEGGFRGDVLPQSLPSFVAMNAAAYFIGYVSFITPSGLGFREGALALMLGAFFPGPVAVAIAFLTRIWSTGGEMLGVVIALWGAPRKQSVAAWKSGSMKELDASQTPAPPYSHIQ
jgi:glycosyltransferase 2 family protein